MTIRKCLTGIELWTCLASIMAAFATIAPASAADIKVVLDRDEVVTLPARVATIVIGNPLIADAALQPGGRIIITGKSYGVTNIIVLDRAGTVLMDRSIEVRGPDDVTTVHGGMLRQSYSCTPLCRRRDVLGDAISLTPAASGQPGAGNTVQAPGRGNAAGQSSGPATTPTAMQPTAEDAKGRAAREKPGGREPPPSGASQAKPKR
jgi:hypothetical protein